MKTAGNRVAVGIAALASVMVCSAGAIGIGDPMPAADVRMQGVDGRTFSLSQIKGSKGTLVVFTCNHCPFVKAWQDRMVQLANDYGRKGLGVAFVNSNDPTKVEEDGLEPMKKLSTDKGYEFPYLVDATSGVATAFGATRTPEAFLFNAEGKLVYHGTIDDSTYDPAKVTKHYLADAAASLVAGEKIAAPETKAVGCSIKFRAEPGK